MDRIDDLSLFRALVDNNGVTAAARALGSSPPVVSRRLSALEARLGSKLIDRSARRFLVTAEGAIFHKRCCAILDQIRDAEAEASRASGILAGPLRISIPCDFGRRRIAPAIGNFAASHPGLDIHVVPSDAGLHPGRDGLDVVLRIDRPNDRSLIIRKLGTTRLTLCAAPSYIDRYGMPSRPSELADHHCLRLARRDGLVDAWRLTGNGRATTVGVGGSLSSSSGELLRDWALAGLGIGLEARWDIEDDLSHGRLVRVLPAWEAPRLELFATYLPGKPVAQRVRTFIDEMVALLATAKSK